MLFNFLRHCLSRNRSHEFEVSCEKMKKIAVIGAGVNGLSSAVQIVEYFSRDQVEVTLISEKVSPDTTGDISAGLWGPYLIGDTPEEKIE